MQRHLAQGNFEGQTSDNGYHLGSVWPHNTFGDQLYTQEVYSTRKTYAHFLEGTDGFLINIFYERFDICEFLQLDAGLGLRLLKFARAEGGVHYQGTISDNAFSQTFSSPTAGYNVGLGVDVWKLSLDVTYYGSFADHTGSWNDIPLSYNRSQILVSLGVKL